MRVRATSDLSMRPPWAPGDLLQLAAGDELEVPDAWEGFCARRGLLPVSEGRPDADSPVAKRGKK